MTCKLHIFTGWHNSLVYVKRENAEAVKQAWAE